MPCVSIYINKTAGRQLPLQQSFSTACILFHRNHLHLILFCPDNNLENVQLLFLWGDHISPPAASLHFQTSLSGSFEISSQDESSGIFSQHRLDRTVYKVIFLWLSSLSPVCLCISNMISISSSFFFVVHLLFIRVFFTSFVLHSFGYGILKYGIQFHILYSYVSLGIGFYTLNSDHCKPLNYLLWVYCPAPSTFAANWVQALYPNILLCFTLGLDPCYNSYGALLMATYFIDVLRSSSLHTSTWMVFQHPRICIWPSQLVCSSFFLLLHSDQVCLAQLFGAQCPVLSGILFPL